MAIYCAICLILFAGAGCGWMTCNDTMFVVMGLLGTIMLVLIGIYTNEIEKRA